MDPVAVENAAERVAVAACRWRREQRRALRRATWAACGLLTVDDVWRAADRMVSAELAYLDARLALRAVLDDVAVELARSP